MNHSLAAPSTSVAPSSPYSRPSPFGVSLRPSLDHACGRRPGARTGEPGRQTESDKSRLYGFRGLPGGAHRLDSARQAVGIEATFLNVSSRSPSTAIPVIASAPSATATARSVSTRPARGSRAHVGVGHRLTQPRYQPGVLGEFSQHPQPRVRHHPCPSALIFNRGIEPLRFTLEVAL